MDEQLIEKAQTAAHQEDQNFHDNLDEYFTFYIFYNTLAADGDIN